MARLPSKSGASTDKDSTWAPTLILTAERLPAISAGSANDASGAPFTVTVRFLS